MASELKPCLLCEGEAKLLRRSGTAGRACPSKWYRERVECKVCGLTTREYKKPGAAAHSWNTRPAPAATDTGLETVSPKDYDFYEDGELVTRSQAEELLAAERAEKEIAERNRDAARENFLTMQKTAAKLLERAEKAEAENAALTARIKELEQHSCDNGFCNTDHWYDKAKALEAKLAAAEKALEPFAEYCGDHFDKDYDGNPLPDEQKVGWVYLNYGHFRKARAVLGGKSS